MTVVMLPMCRFGCHNQNEFSIAQAKHCSGFLCQLAGGLEQLLASEGLAEQVHFYRNVFSHVPRPKMREVAAVLKAIHARGHFRCRGRFRLWMPYANCRRR